MEALSGPVKRLGRPHDSCGRRAMQASRDRSKDDGPAHRRLYERALDKLRQRYAVFGHEGEPDPSQDHRLHPVLPRRSKACIEINAALLARRHYHLAHLAGQPVDIAPPPTSPPDAVRCARRACAPAAGSPRSAHCKEGRCARQPRPPRADLAPPGRAPPHPTFGATREVGLGYRDLDAAVLVMKFSEEARESNMPDRRHDPKPDGDPVQQSEALGKRAGCFGLV